MDTPDTPADAGEIATLETRLTAVSAAIRELFKVAVDSIEADLRGKPMDLDAAKHALGSGLTLLEHALVSVTEIADAQQRIAALMEAEHVLALEAVEAAKREAIEKSNPSRAFIGQKG